MLDSNPLQVLLYFLVLLDAAVVIAEILIDLHAMRSQYTLCSPPENNLKYKTEDGFEDSMYKAKAKTIDPKIQRQGKIFLHRCQDRGQHSFSVIIIIHSNIVTKVVH